MRTADEPHDLGATIAVCKPFAAVPFAATSALHASMTPRHFAPGEALFLQGGPGDAMYMIEAGRAHAELRGPDGVSRTIGTFGPSDLVGEMALLTRQPRSADVIADTAVRAGYVSAADFDELATLHPELGHVLTQVVADRLGGGAHDGMSGKEVGGCRIVRSVGRGAMAVVYEAFDGACGGRVALKMMSHRLIYEREALTRFQREADIAQSVDHPHIARVFRRFPAFRTNFIVMEFLDGPTIAELVATRAACDAVSVQRIVGQLGSALRHLHERSLMHRDLKPGNVILAPGGRAVLADFGLAKAASNDAAGAITQVRAIVGTPLYLPPAQCLGEPAGPDADVYALATMALEMLLGVNPFMGTNMTEVFERKLTWELPPAASVAGGISPELHAFFRAALAARAADRSVDLAKIASWAAPVGAA